MGNMSTKPTPVQSPIFTPIVQQTIQTPPVPELNFLKRKIYTIQEETLSDVEPCKKVRFENIIKHKCSYCANKRELRRGCTYCNSKNKKLANETNPTLISSISHRDRSIFVYKGQVYYKSTGRHSYWKGMIFPCKHTDVKILLKDRTPVEVKHSRIFIRKIPDLIAFINADNPVSKCEKGSYLYLLVEDFMKKFSTLSQIKTSFCFGGGIWESIYGEKIAKYFMFDLLLKNTLGCSDHSIIDIDDPNASKKVGKFVTKQMFG